MGILFQLKKAETIGNLFLIKLFLDLMAKIKDALFHQMIVKRRE